MTSPGRSQIVATGGPEGRGTTEFPSRQPRPSNTFGTADSEVRGAAIATGATRIRIARPKTQAKRSDQPEGRVSHQDSFDREVQSVGRRQCVHDVRKH